LTTLVHIEVKCPALKLNWYLSPSDALSTLN